MRTITSPAAPSAFVTELNRDYGHDLLEFRIGRGGFTEIVARSPGGGSAVISLYGGHLLTWEDQAGRDVLFLSSGAEFEAGKAIRGGIPNIFPWFGKGDGRPRSHGFARTTMWEFVCCELLDDTIRISLGLNSDDASRKEWANDFSLLQTHIIGRTLRTEVQLTNCSDEPCDYQLAFHSYLRIRDVGEVAVEGLQGARYLDNTQGMREAIQREDQLRFAGLVDRIYVGRQTPLRFDTGLGYGIELESSLPDRVMWNPGENAAAGIGDLPVGAYQQFLCAEAAAAATKINLEPRESWRGRQVIGVIPL